MLRTRRRFLKCSSKSRPTCFCRISLTGLEVINDKPAAEFWKEAAGK